MKQVKEHVDRMADELCDAQRCKEELYLFPCTAPFFLAICPVFL